MTALLVAAGGAVGVLARYALGTTVAYETLPWVTVAINVGGSFLLGLLMSAGEGLPPAVRSALAIGVLGGFTTFSTFSVDVLRQLEAGQGGKALLYVAGSVGLGLGAAALGLLAGRAATA
jgi:fluoride exporter